MKVFLAAILLLAASGLDQQAYASLPGSHSIATSRHSSVKVLVQQCRAKERAMGIRGKRMRHAVFGCLEEARPDLKPRLKCSERGADQGLSSQKLRAYVRSCLNARRQSASKSS